MTRANQWLVFGGTLSVGAGFPGGMMFGRRTMPANIAAFGRAFRVGSDIFVDRAALEYLKARADEWIVNGRWTGLRFTDRWMFLELFHEGQVFPGQQGPVYALRSTPPSSETCCGCGTSGTGAPWRTTRSPSISRAPTSSWGRCNALRATSESFRPVWATPLGAASAGARAMRELAAELLCRVGLLAPEDAPYERQDKLPSLAEREKEGVARLGAFFERFAAMKKAEAETCPPKPWMVEWAHDLEASLAKKR